MGAVQDVLRGLGRTLLDFVFPDHCLSCGHPLEDGARHLCPRCRLALRPRLREIPLPGLGPDAPGMPRRAFHLYDFEGPARALIHALKYGGMPSVAGFIVREAAGALDPRDELRNRIVVPVPLHAVRRRERGYNQADLLARAVADTLGAPLNPGGAGRVRPTGSQARLDRRERMQNVRNAFRAGAVGLLGRHVLLVDDVVTTGATMSATASALLEGGAATVVCLALASAAPPADSAVDASEPSSKPVDRPLRAH